MTTIISSTIDYNNILIEWLQSYPLPMTTIISSSIDYSQILIQWLQ